MPKICQMPGLWLLSGMKSIRCSCSLLITLKCTQHNIHADAPVSALNRQGLWPRLFAVCCSLLWQASMAVRLSPQSGFMSNEVPLSSTACLGGQVVEEARRNRLVGASLEARVLLHFDKPHLAEALSAWNDLPNGIDPLRYAFIVSQVPGTALFGVLAMLCSDNEDAVAW